MEEGGKVREMPDEDEEEEVPGELEGVEAARGWHCRFLPELQEHEEKHTSATVFIPGFCLTGPVTLDLKRGIVAIEDWPDRHTKVDLEAITAVR